jgi:gliding motility-associated-like protein
LSQGTYTLTVTDAGGCTVSSSPITVNAIAGPSIDVTAIVITDENCNQANGAISGISINGGTPNYSYAWSGTSQTTLDLVGLSQGSYTLTVSDQNGCTASSSAFAILNIAGPSINETAVSVSNVLCDGTLGSIVGLSDTGNGNNYSWTNGGGSALNASNLLPGSYVLTITDNSGCTVLSNPYVVAPPAGLTIDTSGISISQTACSTNTGSVSGIIIVGGSNPVPSWSNGLGTLDISNLAAGSYTLIVSDDESCSDTVGVTISTVNGPTINMSAIAIESEHCGQSDGSISGISVTGGTPTYNYQWNGSSSIGTDILNAAAGSYTLTVTDAQGCTASATASINALSVPIINSNTIVVVQPTCISGGSINGITVVAGGTYTYSWTNTAQSTLDLNNLSAGTYVLTVTDAFGCSSTAGPVTILAPENPVAVFDYLPQDPGINQEVSFDNASQNIVSSVWTLDSTTISSENISYTFENEGIYEVLLVVTDANGCIDSVMQVITITGDLQIPNVITDNSDGVNDIFEIQGLKENTSLVILNRWGQKVFETSNYANDWKGLDLTGEKLTEGVYSYFLQTAEGQKEHGFVHLIR